MGLVLELLRSPHGFFVRLRLGAVQWVVPIGLLLMVWVLGSAIPLLLGELLQKDLLASLLVTGIAWLILVFTAFFLGGTTRILEVLGFSVLPLLLAMVLMGVLWFLGDLARGIGSALTLVALFLTIRSVFIGLLVMTQSPLLTWRILLISPLLTFFFMAVPFGLLVRWLGLV
jgi:hypothetical protein